MSDEKLEAIRAAMREHGGCGDSSCTIAKPRGMATNGRCRCHEPYGRDQENRLASLLRRIRETVGRPERAP